MKNYLAVVILGALVNTISAQTYQSPVGPQRPVRAIEKKPPVVHREDVQGAIPRGVRGGNPLQLLNPNAPAKYGTAEQSVILDPVTGKWRGIKLFEIFF